MDPRERELSEKWANARTAAQRDLRTLTDGLKVLHSVEGCFPVWEALRANYGPFVYTISN